MKVFHYNEIPDGFLDSSSTGLAGVLAGPSLILLKGRRDPPLFVSTLLHGNETTGFEAIKILLRRYLQSELPRSMLLFIGNVQAAEQGVRSLPGQSDFNRIWNGQIVPEKTMADEVLHTAQQQQVFASVDIHNTTGRNPMYACINHLNRQSLSLARLFSRNIVYFLNPKEVLSYAMSKFTPSITIEGGLSGDSERVQSTVEFLDACLHLSEVPYTDLRKQDFNIYHSFARVLIPPGTRVEIGPSSSDFDFCFVNELDRYNFCDIKPGTRICRVSDPQLRLIALNSEGQDVADDFFLYQSGEIVAKQAMIPSLFTSDPEIIRRDCVGYLMEPLQLTEASLS